MYNLFLDDVRTPEMVANYLLPIKDRKQFLTEDWVIVRNYDEFVAIIEEKGLPAKVSFDHDLADVHYDPKTWTEGFIYQEKTGADCAEFLVKKLIEKPRHVHVIIHSQNPYGRKNIEKALTKHLVKIKLKP